MSKAFTPAEDGAILQYAHAGKTAKEIARLMPERDHQAIWNRARRLGLNLRRRPPLMDAHPEALRLAKENLAFEIALAKAEWRSAPPYKPPDSLI
jgi:hypothetical protein